MDIGEKLKVLREAKGLSQRELASRAGMTNGAISMIEKNRTSPSVSSLKRILDGISMPLSEFFQVVEDDVEAKYFYRKGEFIQLSPQDIGLGGQARGLSLMQLGDASRHNLQVLFETYPPGTGTGPEPLTHDSEEAGVIVAGEVELTVDGQVATLGPGDGYIFDSRLPHRFHNHGDEECVLISACTPPSF